MTKKIDFSGKRAWNPTSDSMSFEVEIDGNKKRCLISREALEDHYGAYQGKTVEQAFDDNQSAIEVAARKLINNDQTDAQSEYLIKSQDI